jgi:hypothetical protein
VCHPPRIDNRSFAPGGRRSGRKPMSNLTPAEIAKSVRRRRTFAIISHPEHGL